MGSKSKKVDPSVGTLVWVRRRNGSWWPGRIMGMHELPDACVLSAKNQTPVKFLGRDNANMDWYNLDTTRRVKAFHCAEFRDCVEKAKASKGCQVMVGSKRAVKYARREDAILHALELEKESEAQKHEVVIRAVGGTRKEHKDVDAEGNKQELTQSGISFEDPNDSNLKLHSLLKKRRKTPNDSEDDGSEGVKRMRGINDLVNGVVAKGKANVKCKTEVLVPVKNAPSISEPKEEDKLTHVFDSKSSFSFLKKKTQNQVASICETLKRKYRRRQLRKVLEHSTLVSVPVFCDEGSGSVPSYYQEIKDRKDSMLDSMVDSSVLIYSSKDFPTGLGQKHTSPDASESRNSELSSISEIPEDDFSDSSLYDVPFVDDETHCQGVPLEVYEPTRLSGQSSQVKSISLSCEGLDKYGSTSFTTEHHYNSSRKTKKGTSKWQLKGKRNSRSLGKKMNDMLYLGNPENRDVEADDFLPGTSHMDELYVDVNPEIHADTLDESFLSEDDGGGWSEHDDDDVADPSYDYSSKFKKQRSKKRKVKMSAHGRGGKFMSLSSNKSGVAKPQTEGSLAVLSLKDPRSASHHQSFFLGNSRNDVSDVSSINFQWGSSLFDVNLEVRASYSGQSVPLVSLMSKYSGKAIVGHPLTVEVCSYGYCDILLNSVNYSPMENFSDQLIHVEDEAVAGTSRTEPSLYFSRKKPGRHSKSSKKSSKSKKNGITSKKTRSLSSFSGLPKQEAGRQTLVEKLKGDNVMACIPLTIVFSRINESLS
ncbi:hypothetical protein C5167_044096 [Papaver somniferum]|uniref:PWWP domain-containing protein n=1 Tax=Papaver somniferum TaxID=3469 RepID=A0A4Y7LAI0_PAPSO|nr:uncharacterized protein At1g51745-like [Papaver somniferum]XP_026422037.1 uncharacterized protein At1g51745-like [Papaver somniferum]RZC81518.1 hypothetical protein C5167_044096 [Papaver somniferum]